MTKNVFSLVNKSNLLTLALATLTCVGFNSCSSDDNGGNDDGGSSTGENAGKVTTEDGSQLLITRVGDTKFTYNSAGKLSKVEDDGNNYTVTYNPLTFTDKGSNYSDVYKVSLNGAGYASKMETSYTYTSSEESEEQAATITFSYDGSGHLTKISGTATYSDYEDGKKVSDKSTMSCSLNWSSNKLTSYSYKAQSSDASYAEEITFRYDAEDGYANTLHQFASSYWGESFFDDVTFLSYLGLLGKGGDYLPTSCTKIITSTTEEDGAQGHATTIPFSYSFNSDGSLNYEIHNGSRIRYEYNAVSTSDEDESADAQVKSRQTKHLHGIFSLLHHNK